MKLIKATVKKVAPKAEKRATGTRGVKAITYTPKKYLYVLNVVHDDINCIVSITNEDSEEVERRYGKRGAMNDLMSKMARGYKRIKIGEPKRVLTTIVLPTTDYKPESKASLKEYAPRIYTNHEKFIVQFQELVNQLDENKMRVEIEYHGCGEACYKVDMIPKSIKMATGIHRVLMKLDVGIYKYFYGESITSLKLICETDSITKLFNDE